MVATISRSISVASIYEKRIRSPFRSTERISLFAALTWHLSIAALILCITDLAVGLKLVVTGRTSRKFRIFIKVVAVLIVLLAVTFFALAQWTFSTDSFVGSVVVAILGVTILALHLIGDLSIAIFATRQRITIAKSQSPLTGCANRILGAAWFGFFLFAWSIIHTFTIPLVAVDSQYGYLAYDIVDLILGSFGTLGIFVLLFQVIRRDTAGLWSGSASVRPKDQGEVSA